MTIGANDNGENLNHKMSSPDKINVKTERNPNK